MQVTLSNIELTDIVTAWASDAFGDRYDVAGVKLPDAITYSSRASTTIDLSRRGDKGEETSSESEFPHEVTDAA